MQGKGEPYDIKVELLPDVSTEVVDVLAVESTDTVSGHVTPRPVSACKFDPASSTVNNLGPICFEGEPNVLDVKERLDLPEFFLLLYVFQLPIRVGVIICISHILIDLRYNNQINTEV